MTLTKKKRFVIRSVILALLALAVAYTLYANLNGDRDLVREGDPAPDFVLKDLNGNSYRLSDYRGKGVFLNFWGTYCKPCKKEMPYIDRAYRKYKDRGVEVIAVNVGETDMTIQNFVDKYGLSFPVVVDREGEVQDAYDIFPLPATFLIDADGKIVKYYEGELTEDLVEQFMERVKP
ncbi:thiol-disulfide oxidoreductase ResA [Caldibacillus debilis]|uniref:Thioredoxin domain-containing protein n=1 Tax=Caldibacillus debilis TaxID=301148 RepID=A0A150M7X1_9BACI|nr:thiol-disulfide oxidoreductase ResA [Caldibacillus debilis]KYD20209.1 hypothetical protein B4135_1985 [Caldibacillus debilis]MBO2482857.1 thiol-disulfide oxidoreductase [Bacillaceae bacterium]